MDQQKPDSGVRMTEHQADQLRQGAMLGRMRYVLGISLTLAVLAFVVVFVVVSH
jgi:hypothetical protein